MSKELLPICDVLLTSFPRKDNKYSGCQPPMSTLIIKKFSRILWGFESTHYLDHDVINKHFQLITKRVSSRVFIIFFKIPYRKIKYWCIKEREEKFEQI